MRKRRARLPSCVIALLACVPGGCGYTGRDAGAIAEPLEAERRPLRHLESECDIGGSHCLHQNADYAKEERAAAAGLGRPTSGKGVILILAQNTANKQTFRSDPLIGLKRTLGRIYRNYNDRWRDDVVLAHTGDFDARAQADVIAGRPEVSFLLIDGENWRAHPPGVEHQKWYARSKWGLGYRNMIRFFAIRIWPLLANRGYRWVMRFDDDSHLMSPIPYNVFGFMEAHNLSYAYRSIARDQPHGDLAEFDSLEFDANPDLWFRFVRRYVAEHRGGDPGWLLDSCWLGWRRQPPPAGAAPVETAGASAGGAALHPWRLDPDGKKKFPFLADTLLKAYGIDGRVSNEPPFAYENCGTPWGMYNNFFVADLHRFLAPDVQHLLSAFDDSGTIYTRRWGDLSIHSVVAQLLLPKAQVFQFTGWGYMHSTGAPDMLHFGVAQAGKDRGIPQQLQLMREYYTKELNWSFPEERLVEINGMVSEAFGPLPICDRVTILGPRRLMPLWPPVPRYQMC